MKSIEKTISSIFNEIEELYRIYFPSSFAYALSNIIANRLQITSFINNFEEENHEIIDNRMIGHILPYKRSNRYEFV